MKYESLIFDIDGTLWDSREVVAEGYNLQLKDEGLEHYFVDAERLRGVFGKVLTVIADELFPELEPAERYPLLDRCIAREDQHLAEDSRDIGYPGAAEAMEALAKNHRLFIVSNSQCGYPELCIRKLGLEKWIRGHLCYGDTGASKGKNIRTLMEQRGIENCAYIGDTQGDYEATLEAGVPFIWASYGFDTPAGYDIKIDDIRDLIRLDEEGKL